MSTKVIAWAIAVIVVVLGAWYFLSRPSATSAPSTATSDQAESQEQASGTQATSTDTSDAALDQDAASIDTQLQAASTDSSSASSFSDTPVQQTE